MKHIFKLGVVTGLLASAQVSAQIYESTFTDTNNVVVHAPATQLLLNPASNLLMAVYPSENGKTGTAEFMIQIDELK